MQKSEKKVEKKVAKKVEKKVGKILRTKVIIQNTWFVLIYHLSYQLTQSLDRVQYLFLVRSSIRKGGSWGLHQLFFKFIRARVIKLLPNISQERNGSLWIGGLIHRLGKNSSKLPLTLPKRWILRMTKFASRYFLSFLFSLAFSSLLSRSWKKNK